MPEFNQLPPDLYGNLTDAFLKTLAEMSAYVDQTYATFLEIAEYPFDPDQEKKILALYPRYETAAAQVKSMMATFDESGVTVELAYKVVSRARKSKITYELANSILAEMRPEELTSETTPIEDNASGDELDNLLAALISNQPPSSANAEISAASDKKQDANKDELDNLLAALRDDSANPISEESFATNEEADGINDLEDFLQELKTTNEVDKIIAELPIDPETGADIEIILENNELDNAISDMENLLVEMKAENSQPNPPLQEIIKQHEDIINRMQALKLAKNELEQELKRLTLSLRKKSAAEDDAYRYQRTETQEKVSRIGKLINNYQSIYDDWQTLLLKNPDSMNSDALLNYLEYLKEVDVNITIFEESYRALKTPTQSTEHLSEKNKEIYYSLANTQKQMHQTSAYVSEYLLVLENVIKLNKENGIKTKKILRVFNKLKKAHARQQKWKKQQSFTRALDILLAGKPISIKQKRQLERSLAHEQKIQEILNRTLSSALSELRTYLVAERAETEQIVKQYQHNVALLATLSEGQKANIEKQYSDLSDKPMMMIEEIIQRLTVNPSSITRTFNEPKNAKIWIQFLISIRTHIENETGKNHNPASEPILRHEIIRMMPEVILTPAPTPKLTFLQRIRQRLRALRNKKKPPVKATNTTTLFSTDEQNRKARIKRYGKGMLPINEELHARIAERGEPATTDTIDPLERILLELQAENESLTPEKHATESPSIVLTKKQVRIINRAFTLLEKNILQDCRIVEKAKTHVAFREKISPEHDKLTTKLANSLIVLTSYRNYLLNQGKHPERVGKIEHLITQIEAAKSNLAEVKKTPITDFYFLTTQNPGERVGTTETLKEALKQAAESIQTSGSKASYNDTPSASTYSPHTNQTATFTTRWHNCDFAVGKQQVRAARIQHHDNNGSQQTILLNKEDANQLRQMGSIHKRTNLGHFFHEKSVFPVELLRQAALDAESYFIVNPFPKPDEKGNRKLFLHTNQFPPLLAQAMIIAYKQYGVDLIPSAKCTEQIKPVPRGQMNAGLKQLEGMGFTSVNLEKKRAAAKREKREAQINKMAEQTSHQPKLR